MDSNGTYDILNGELVCFRNGDELDRVPSVGIVNAARFKDIFHSLIHSLSSQSTKEAIIVCLMIVVDIFLAFVLKDSVVQQMLSYQVGREKHAGLITALHLLAGNSYQTHISLPSQTGRGDK